jgi:hypothetical protein
MRHSEPGAGIHELRITIHNSRPSALSAAVTACRVLADFTFFVKELSASLAELFAAAVLELADRWMIGESVFHGGPPPRSRYENR